MDPNDDDFLPNLMEEFPHLYLAPETIKKMWMDHQHQSAAINKRLEEDKRKQSKAKATVCVLYNAFIRLFINRNCYKALLVDSYMTDTCSYQELV